MLVYKVWWLNRDIKQLWEGQGGHKKEENSVGLSDPTIFVWDCVGEEFERVLTDTEVNLQVSHKRRAFALSGRPLCFANVSIAMNWVILA